MADLPLRSPLAAHASTPVELKQRLEAERSGQPHLIYRDLERRQVIYELSRDRDRVTIGRRPESDVSLAWDREVSRLHAELRRVGRDWTIVDDGISRNGSFVNTLRLQGRHRLIDGDVIVVGQTVIVFLAPGASFDRTKSTMQFAVSASVTPAERLVLRALCRPLQNPNHALPASNQEIADELHISIPAVKKRLGVLFERFGLAELPQTEKRTRLAAAALRLGVVSSRDL
jgi:hypothetical protein